MHAFHDESALRIDKNMSNTEQYYKKKPLVYDVCLILIAAYLEQSVCNLDKKFAFFLKT